MITKKFNVENILITVVCMYVCMFMYVCTKNLLNLLPNVVVNFYVATKWKINAHAQYFIVKTYC